MSEDDEVGCFFDLTSDEDYDEWRKGILSVTFQVSDRKDKKENKENKEKTDKTENKVTKGMRERSDGGDDEEEMDVSEVGTDLNEEETFLSYSLQQVHTTTLSVRSLCVCVLIF